jgi:CHAD domain-containing protein
VFLDDLRERRQRQSQGEQPGFDYLAGYALGRRSVEQEHLLSVCMKEGSDFEDFVDLILDEVRSPRGADSDTTLARHAREMLGSRLHKLESATDEDLTDYANLHQVRIQGKRLRYAMEVFADCFPGEFREELYSQVEGMQEALGKANDSHVAVGRLSAQRDQMKRARPAEWKLWQSGVNSLLHFHQRRLPQERRRFLKLWQQWHRPKTATLWELVLAEEAEAALSARP